MYVHMRYSYVHACFISLNFSNLQQNKPHQNNTCCQVIPPKIDQISNKNAQKSNKTKQNARTHKCQKNTIHNFSCWLQNKHKNNYKQRKQTTEFRQVYFKLGNAFSEIFTVSMSLVLDFCDVVRDV